MKIYHYVGNSKIKDNLSKLSHRLNVISSLSVSRWLTQTPHPKNPDNSITLTFIVDTDWNLWVNYRHSEHILCADGGDVLSAGEMTVDLNNDHVDIVAITNQSTGYCPEPESYPAVKLALSKTDIPHPPHFTTAYDFRLCDVCGTTNLIKDDWFVCGVCDRDLSLTWNYG